MALISGLMNGSAAGSVIAADVPSPWLAMPDASDSSTTWPPRAITSCMLDTVFSKRGPDGAITITGTFSSISAMGPCLSSPAA